MDVGVETERETSTVVDINQFRAARARRQALRDDAAVCPADSGTIAAVPLVDLVRARALSEREVEHRARMLRHLARA